MTLSSLNNPALNGSLSGHSLLPKSNGITTGVQGESTKLASTPAAESKSLSLEENRQSALQVVNRTLTMAYEKLASRGQSASAEYETFEPLTAEKVANNILGFIERRLQLDAADGATQEELQARLEAGLSGFKKGFAEASEKLEALSLLSPEIEADIGKTYDLVLEGVDELRAKFIKTTEAPPAEQASPKPAAATDEVVKSAGTAKPALALEVPDFIPAAGSYLGYANYEYGRAREFSFELTTKDGDKVTIRAASSEGFAVEAGRNGSVSALNASYSSSESFSLSIEGDLSEEELVAINDLLGKVNDLAGQFFAGNLDGAFEQAMNMGYDSNQIGSFALNLAQAEIQQVTKAYQAFEPARDNEAGSGSGMLGEQLLPLGNFIRDLLDSLDRSSIFAEPQSLLKNMAEKITGQEEQDQAQGQRFRNFIDEIFALKLR